MGLWQRWRHRFEAAVTGLPVPDGDDATGTAPSSPPARVPAPRASGASGGPAGPAASDRPASPARGVSADLPRQVTRERIVASMTRFGYHYLTDERGDLCGLWGYRLFSFHLVRDSVLQVRARWPRLGNIERLWELLEICEGWNRRKPYPKCYVRVQDDGRVHVLTETAVPVAVGLTDAQLDHHLQVGLAAGTAVFDELDRRYPDPVTSGPAA